LVKNHSDDVSHSTVTQVTSIPPITGRAHAGRRSIRSASSLVANAP
jgi:hypothetical protein